MHLFKAPIPFCNIHNIILKITNIVQPYCPLSSHFKIKLIQPNFPRQILPSPSCGWKKKYDCLILSREHLGIWYQTLLLKCFDKNTFIEATFLYVIPTCIFTQFTQQCISYISTWHEVSLDVILNVTLLLYQQFKRKFSAIYIDNKPMFSLQYSSSEHKHITEL